MNDAQSLERLIESCYQDIDYIFVIDGKYKDYDSILPISTDNLEDLCDKYPNVVLTRMYNVLEYQKRGEYLELCKEFKIDYLLIVDSDEYFHPDSDFRQFRIDLISQAKRDYVYNIKNHTLLPGLGNMIIPLDQPRLWRKPSELEYKNQRHYQFGRKGKDEVLTARKTLFSIKLIHDPHLRTDERTERHDEYIKKLTAYEEMKQLIETNREKAQREYCVWSGN
jgi:glycosyltransferase involved in cell wall biosynthesis